MTSIALSNNPLAVAADAPTAIVPLPAQTRPPLTENQHRTIVAVIQRAQNGNPPRMDMLIFGAVILGDEDSLTTYLNEPTYHPAFLSVVKIKGFIRGTVLHVAASIHNDDRIVRLILNRLPKPFLDKLIISCEAGNEGRTALIASMEGVIPCPQITYALINARSYLFSRDSESIAPISVLFKNCDFKYQNQFECLKFLMDAATSISPAKKKVSAALSNCLTIPDVSKIALSYLLPYCPEFLNAGIETALFNVLKCETTDITHIALRKLVISMMLSAGADPIKNHFVFLDDPGLSNNFSLLQYSYLFSFEGAYSLLRDHCRTYLNYTEKELSNLEADFAVTKNLLNKHHNTMVNIRELPDPPDFNGCCTIA